MNHLSLKHESCYENDLNCTSSFIVRGRLVSHDPSKGDLEPSMRGGTVPWGNGEGFRSFIHRTSVDRTWGSGPSQEGVKVEVRVPTEVPEGPGVRLPCVFGPVWDRGTLPAVSVTRSSSLSKRGHSPFLTPRTVRARSRPPPHTLPSRPIPSKVQQSPSL